MRPRLLCVVACACAPVTTPCLAQGIFLDPGVSAAYTHGGVAIDGRLVSYGATVGRSVGGVFDVGFSVTRSRSRARPVISGVVPCCPAPSGTVVSTPAYQRERSSAVALGPTVAYHLFKRRSPCGVVASGSYRLHSSSYTGDAGGHELTLGASTYRPLHFLPGLTITPEAGVTYTMATRDERQEAHGIPYTVHVLHWQVMPVVGLHASFSLPRGAIVHMDTVLGYAEIEEPSGTYRRRSLSLGIGVVAPGAK